MRRATLSRARVIGRLFVVFLIVVAYWTATCCGGDIVGKSTLLDRCGTGHRLTEVCTVLYCGGKISLTLIAAYLLCIYWRVSRPRFPLPRIWQKLVTHVSAEVINRALNEHSTERRS